MENIINNILAECDTLTEKVKAVVEDQKDKVLRFAQDEDAIYGFPLHDCSFEETPIIALAIIDNDLCAYMPPAELADYNISTEEMLEGDWWYSVTRFSEMYYVQTIFNIADSFSYLIK